MKHYLPTFIDLNAPDNTPVSVYRKLWRAVVIQGLRDACADNDSAKQHAEWTETKDFEFICACADLSHSMVKAKFKAIGHSQEVRIKTFEAMSYFKSRVAPLKKGRNLWG